MSTNAIDVLVFMPIPILILMACTYVQLGMVLLFLLHLLLLPLLLLVLLLCSVATADNDVIHKTLSHVLPVPLPSLIPIPIRPVTVPVPSSGFPIQS